jgi:hypothetical protein
VSLKDRIRAKKRKGLPLEVPEWGETVHVRRMSAREVLDFREWVKAQEARISDEAQRNVATLLHVVRLTVVDEHGNPLFGVDDDHWLADTDQGALERIFNAALDAAGASEKAREGIRKNSETAAGASPAASPSPLDSPPLAGSWRN